MARAQESDKGRAAARELDRVLAAARASVNCPRGDPALAEG